MADVTAALLHSHAPKAAASAAPLEPPKPAPPPQHTGPASHVPAAAPHSVDVKA